MTLALRIARALVELAAMAGGLAAIVAVLVIVTQA